MNYEYDLVFENNDPRDNNISIILDEINDNIARYEVFLDVHDIDENGIDCAVDFNHRTGEDEFFVLDEISETLRNKGITFAIDNYPDIDECGLSYSYGVYINI